MKKYVKTIAPDTPKLEKPKRVAAYARVSCAKDAMLHSLSAQVSKYSEMIQSHPGWVYRGVYSDEGLSGTREDRPGLQRMLRDCREGKIDLIITKSISRFARNTVLFISTMRELRSLGVDVFFEEQNIHSLSSEGELMITLLAGFAQEEALSVSRNQKWRVNKNFTEGRPWNCTMLGYRSRGGVLETVPAEAEIVKRIFRLYLEGHGTQSIANILNGEGVSTRLGKRFSRAGLMKILKNYSYTGNLLLQKTYREDGIGSCKRVNNGELPKYHVERAHEAIVDPDTFEAAQKEIAKRRDICSTTGKPSKTYPFTGLITCAYCGRHYHRKTTPYGFVWICGTYNNEGKTACPSKRIPEKILTEITADVDMSRVSGITADAGNRLLFRYTDGGTEQRVWKDRRKPAKRGETG